MQFKLGRRPFISLISGKVDAPSIPSEAEVKAGNYAYIPCPMDEPPMDSRTFLHHFYASASKHPDTMWGVRLPWKIGPGPAPMAPGWGVHLEERPDWTLFAALMFLCLLLSGLVAGIYAWRAKDNPTGIAIGAWLTATQTMGMTAIFFWRI